MALNDPPTLLAAPEPAQTPSVPDAHIAGARQELVGLLSRLTAGREETVPTAVPGLSVHRISRPGGPQHTIQRPAFAVIAQGSKRLLVGDESYEYDPMHYLVSAVDLPVMAKVTMASTAQPYLGMRLELDVEEVGALIRDEDLPSMLHREAARGLYVKRLDSTMLDTVLRLLRLLETPKDIPILAPLVKREILYRLLMKGEGAQLRQIALQDSHTQRIAKAIRILREHYARPLHVEAIAREVHMSVSSFHHHFKAVTAISPLQYQKQLRLQEARRLMFTGDTDVKMVAHLVGYESASQFSREYSRLFGTSPMRDKRRWLADPASD